MTGTKENVHIRLASDQKERLQSLARDYGKTVTELVMLMTSYIEENRPTFQVKPQDKMAKKKR